MPRKGNSLQPHFHPMPYVWEASFPLEPPFCWYPEGVLSPYYILPQHKANPLCCSTLLLCWRGRIWFLSCEADLEKGHSAAANWSANAVLGRLVCAVESPAFTVSRMHGLGPEGCWAFPDLTDLMSLGRAQPRQCRLEPTALWMKDTFGVFLFYEFLKYLKYCLFSFSYSGGIDKSSTAL